MTINTILEKRSEYTSVLRKSLSSDQRKFISGITAIAKDIEYPLYIVGGFVRDMLLGLSSTDMDIVVEGDASILAELFKKRYGGAVIHHRRFKTISLILPSVTKKNLLLRYDISSARSETYELPGSLPVVRFAKIQDDIRRRDFTINTLAISLNCNNYGTLLDELNGYEDLKNGLIRTIHKDSFYDDPTRIFRAARYAIRFNFILEKATLDNILPGVKHLSGISGQRIRHEIDLIMNEEKPGAILKLLENWQVVEAIHPGISPVGSYIYKVATLPNDSIGERIDQNWTLWLMHLQENIIMEINKRLHLPKRLLEAIIGASKLMISKDLLVNIPPSKVVKILDKYPESSINTVIKVLHEGERKKTLQQYINKWRYVKPKVDVNLFITAGIHPGPEYSAVLLKIRDALLDGRINTYQDEIRYADKLIINLKKES